MSDYSKTTDFSTKDALVTGDPNKIVSGTEHDDEYNNIATAVATKTNKKLPATTNNLATLDATGDLGDSGFYFSGAGGTVTATAAELNKTNTTASQGDLDAITNFEETLSATTSEVSILTTKTLNIVDDGALEIAGTAITATAAELNTACDGITATAAELNTACDGITATAAEINRVCDGSLSGSRSYDLPNISSVAGHATFTISVSGATLGDFSLVSANISLQGLNVTSYVSAAGTVTVVVYNHTGSDVNLASTTWNAKVLT